MLELNKALAEISVHNGGPDELREDDLAANIEAVEAVWSNLNRNVRYNVSSWTSRARSLILAARKLWLARRPDLGYS